MRNAIDINALSPGEDWIAEKEKKTISTTPKASHPLNPANGDWQPVEREPLQNTYTPEVLRGTEYESETKDITKLLFSDPKGFETAVSLDRGKLAWALEAFKGISPDAASKVQKLATDRKIPFEMVQGNKEEWDKWEEARNIFNSLFETTEDEKGKRFKYPNTAAWLIDPVKMAQAKDDVNVLTQIEGVITAYKRPWYNIMGHKFTEGSKSLLRSGISAYQAVHELIGDIAEDDNVIKKSLLTYTPAAPFLAIEEMLGDEGREKVSGFIDKVKASEFIKAKPLPKIGGLEGYAYDFFEMIPQLAGTILATAGAGPGAGAAFIGGHIFGSTYGDLREQDVDSDRAAAAAFGNAAAQSALEYIGLSKLMSMFRATGVKQIANEFIQALIAETGTEFLQSFPEEAAMIWGTAEKEGRDLKEQVEIFIDRLPETAKQGLYEGLLVAPVAFIGGSAKVAYDYGKVKQLDKDLAYWDNYEKLAQESKLKERNPEEFADHTEKILEKAEAPNTFTVPLETITILFQDNEKGFNEFVASMGLDEQIQESKTTGKELEISTSKFASQYAGTDISVGLRNDMRFDPNGMTETERGLLREGMLKDLDNMQREYQELSNENKVPEQVLKLREKLMLPKEEGGFGLKAEDADANLAVLMSGAKVLSKKRGETVQQWFDRVNPVVEVGGDGAEMFEIFQAQGRQFKQNVFLQAKPKGRIGGSVQFQKSQTLIKLFDEANMSTFLHETGHIFIEEIKGLIEGGFADEKLNKDYEAILEFAGKDGVIDQQGHEKLARAFEAYLREGKAPSVKLAAAFNKFRAWLTAIYRTLRGLNGVKLNDDIRPVFDRLLAAEDEIREAKDYYKAKRALADIVPLTETQKTKLAKRQDKAEQTAIDMQVKKYMGAYLSAIGGKSKLRDLAVAEIENQPVYKAMYKAIETKGLNSSDIEEAYGKDAVKQLKSKHSKLVTKKGESSLAELAIDFEFESEQALLDELLKADRKQDAINKRTQQLLEEREKQIKDEIEKQEAVPGEESLHSDANLTYLIAEAEVLAEKLEKKKAGQQTRLESKVFKDFAEDVIANKKVSMATRYDIYAKTEQKWAKKAYEAAQDGKIEEAHEAKKKQIINHALVQAAIKARDEKLKIENKYKATSIKGRLKTVENTYADVAQDLIATFGLSTSDSIKPSSKEVPAITDLDEILAAQTPEWIIKKVKPEGFKNYRDLTMQQLRELDDTIGALIKYGKNELTSLKDGEYKTVDAMVNASTDAMSNLKDKSVYEEFSKKGKVLNKLDGLVARASMMEFVFERLDNYKFTKDNVFGPLRKLFNRGIVAETDYQALKQEAFDMAKPHWETLYKAKKRIEGIYGGKSFDIKELPVIEGMQKLGRKWTTERLIAFVLNMGNEGNLTALKNAYGYTDQQLNLITGLFNKAEFEAIQGIWDATEYLYPKLNQTHFNIYNRNVAKVEAKPLVVRTIDGANLELKGGYYPLQFDHMLNDVVAERKEEDLMKNQTTAVFRSTKPEDGMTQARTIGHALPPDLSLGVWFKHIGNTARYISHAEYMRDLNRVTKDKNFRNAVRDKAGRQMYDKMREWVEYQAKPERKLADADKFFSLENQRRLATIAILGANISVGVKQRLSMFSAAQEIGWKYIFEGVNNSDMKNAILGLDSSQAWQKVVNLSAYMSSRVGSIDREMHDAIKRMNPMVKKFDVAGKEFTWKDVQDFMFTWIQMNDRATVGVVWLGAFNKSMDLNSTKELSEDQRVKASVEYADSIVRTTQPSALPIDLNSFQRSEGALRFFTSFMTWTFKYGNRLVHKNKAFREGAISGKEYFTHMLYENFMSPWGAAVISSMMLTGDLPEWWELFTSPIENAISWVPFLRDVPGSIKYRKDFGVSPAFTGASRIIKSGKTAWQVLEGDKEFAQLAWDIGKAVEVQAGVPALKVASDIKRIYTNITKDEE